MSVPSIFVLSLLSIKQKLGLKSLFERDFSAAARVPASSFGICQHLWGALPDHEELAELSSRIFSELSVNWVVIELARREMA